MINPYKDVNFDTCLKIPSMTHGHCDVPSKFQKYVSYGLKFIPISNYREIPDYTQYDIPDDVIVAPNAEHKNMFTDGVSTVNLLNNKLHMNSLGSLYETGSEGVSDHWKTMVDGTINALKYSDAGGVTINHPNWTRNTSQSNGGWLGMTLELIKKILDYDERVLGIEILNGSSQYEEGLGYDLTTWDAILKTGRRCWGFCVPDWDINDRSADIATGKSVLLLDSFTEHTALKAYRDGAFYGQKSTTSLAFTNISLSGNTLTVDTTGASSIDIVANGVRTSFNANHAVFTIDSTMVYVRIEAHSSDDDIYSNPIVLKKYVKATDDMRELLLV